MAKLLYRCIADTRSENENRDFAILCWRPSLSRWISPGEPKSVRTLLKHIYFRLISAFGGGYRVYYVEMGGGCVHTSYVVGSVWKFRFCPRGACEIGPCNTRAAFRGRGIYPLVLRYIVKHDSSSQNRNRRGEYWMIVDTKNRSSIRGIEKAGFKYMGEAVKSSVLKIYRRAKG